MQSGSFQPSSRDDSSHHSGNRSVSASPSANQLPNRDPLDSRLNMQAGPVMAFSPPPMAFSGHNSVGRGPHVPTSLPSFNSLFSSTTRQDSRRDSYGLPRSNSSSPAIPQYGATQRFPGPAETANPQPRHDYARPHTPGQQYAPVRPPLASPRPVSYTRPAPTPASHHRHRLSLSEYPRQTQTFVPPQQPHDNASHTSHASHASPRSSVGDRNDRSSRASSSASGQPPERPIYLETRFIPGKGSCYMYSDGSAVPTHANGELVNPDMGVTKQNKPRKRQSHACLHCREKKTKCEIGPDRSGPCVACAKGNRLCEWSPGVRTGSNPGSKSDTNGTKRRLQPADEAVRRDSVAQTQSMHHSPGHVSADGRAPKRIKSPQPASGYAPVAQHQQSKQGLKISNVNVAPSAFDGLDEATDPYTLNPEATLRLLVYYFRFRDTFCTQSLPKAAFMRWVTTADKTGQTQDQLMALNSCLAVASIYCKDNDMKEAGKIPLEVAVRMERARHGNYTLPLAQTRLNLAVYHWAHGKVYEAFEYTSSGCRALSALHFNTELGCKDRVSKEAVRNDYGFTDIQLIECRRRTFWVGYCTERYTGHFTGHTCILADEDIEVRVPNNEEDFDAGRDIEGPKFDAGNFSVRGCGHMAAFLGITSIWGNVTRELFRSTLRDPPPDYAKRYEEHYATVCRRLAEWQANRPRQYQIASEGAFSSLQNETFPSYYVLEAGYHLTMMKLNRYCIINHLSLDIVQRNIACARESARAFLDIIVDVSKKDTQHWQTGPISHALLQPYSGSSITVACDVMSAGGPPDELHKVYTNLGYASDVVDQIAPYYFSGKHQRHIIRHRFSEFGAHLHTRDGTAWRFKEPMEESFIPITHDVIYGTSDAVYHGALAGLHRIEFIRREFSLVSRS